MCSTMIANRKSIFLGMLILLFYYENNVWLLSFSFLLFPYHKINDCESKYSEHQGELSDCNNGLTPGKEREGWEKCPRLLSWGGEAIRDSLIKNELSGGAPCFP